MLVRRITALAVLAALVGSLALPWLGDAHQFNDDPHWAIALRADDCTLPVVSDGDAGDETHCEVCHWLRTMRSADRVVTAISGPDAPPVVQLVDVSASLAVATQRPGAARAPPSSL